MSSPFWTNTLWYVMLFASSILSVAIVLRKAENKRFAIAFQLAVLGLILIIEQVIVVFFNAYDYYPKMIDEQHIENIFGNMFSQISISSTAMLIIVLNLSWVWYFIFAAAYFLIQAFFMSLGIFRPYWYQPIFTPLGLVPLFWLFKKWHGMVFAKGDGVLRFVTLYLGTGASFGNLLSFPLLLTGTQLLLGGIFTEPIHDHKATNLFYVLSLAAVMIAIYKWKVRRTWKIAIFVLLLAPLYALNQMGVYDVSEGWFFIVAPANLIVCYGIVWVLDHFLNHGNARSPVN